MPVVEIQDHACVIAVRKGGGSAEAFLRRAVPEADLLSIGRYRIEFSDDPASPEARRSAYPLLKEDVLSRLRSGRSVAVDAAGLQDDQVNNLRKAVPRAYVPGLRIDFAGDGSDLEIRRVRSPTDARHMQGPFDAIGDVHGCIDELLELLQDLGYRVEERADGSGPSFDVTHPQGRRLAFVGDLADRGPDAVRCLALAADACESGIAVWTIGNHDDKLRTFLLGEKTSMPADFAVTAGAVSNAAPQFRERLGALLDSLPSHLVLDGGRLVIAHAGCLEEMQGRHSRYLTAFCMFGAVTGEIDEEGFPVRGDWASGYEGTALVVHGHTPLHEVEWSARGNVACIDTGCCFGGGLTALRWPERSLVAVPSRDVYSPRKGWPQPGQGMAP